MAAGVKQAGPTGKPRTYGGIPRGTFKGASNVQESRLNSGDEMNQRSGKKRSTRKAHRGMSY